MRRSDIDNCGNSIRFQLASSWRRKGHLERSGKWIVIARHLSIEAHAEERCIRVFEQSEAVIILSELRKKSRNVRGILGNLQRLFTAQIIGPVDQ